jgi:alpha-1,2-mannosyltransferase
MLLGAFRLFVAPATFSDLKTYQVEGRAVLHGLDLYGALPTAHGHATTYPPFAAMLFLTTTPLSIVLLEIGYFLGTVALLVWSSIAMAQIAGAGHEQAYRVGWVVASLAIWCEPVYATLGFGQINILLLALVLWDFKQPPHSRLRGIGVGLAAAIKVTPAIFVVYLILTRRIRFAATAIAAFAGAMLASVAAEPDATSRYWADDLFDVGRVGHLEKAVNQSVRGLLVRADHTRDTRPTELLLVLAILIAGLACAVLAHRTLGDAWGLPACAVTGLLSSPISWSHHWVWCVPIVVLLWLRARRWVVPTLAVFWSFAVGAVPHEGSEELHLTRIQIALSSWYILYGLGFLVLTAAEIRRHRDHHEPTDSNRRHGRQRTLTRFDGHKLTREPGARVIGSRTAPTG